MTTKLHLGCGPLALPGWINIDNQPYPGVDRVLDLREGLPFSNASYIFAEHFLEHIPYDAALKLLAECRRALSDDGVLRLSTPNLSWVWVTHYSLDFDDANFARACFELNRAFRGWGHQFLYNETTLRASLLEVGFGEVRFCRYGESEHAELRGLERHPPSPDWGPLQHVLIAEASGRGGQKPEYVDGPRAEYLRDIAVV